MPEIVAEEAVAGSPPAPRRGRVREHLPLVVVTILAALLALDVYVLPSRGLTFLWDDWSFLASIRSQPWPRRWFEPHVGHMLPAFLALFELEWILFRPINEPFLVVSSILHVANVILVGLVARARTKTAIVAAIATAAFGLSTVYREAVWWAACQGIIAATTCALVGLLALERPESGRWRAVLAGVCFLAPCFHGVGLSVAPVLFLEVALARGADRRLLACCALPWLAYAGLYVAVGAQSAARLPRTADELETFVGCFGYAIGTGLVEKGFLLPHAAPGVLAVGYLVASALVASFLPTRERRIVLARHAIFGALFGSIILSRWYGWQPIVHASSRYQYLPAIAWVSLIASALDRAPAIGRWLAAAAVALLAVGQLDAAKHETRLCAPPFRHDQALFVTHVVSAARAARAEQWPTYDAPLPLVYPLKASILIGIMAPDAAPVWTSTRTGTTVLPWFRDPVVRELAFAEKREVR